MEEDKVIYKELSYKIIGLTYEVFNELGLGYQEKHYQKAMESIFVKNNIKFKSQCPYKIIFEDKAIGRYFMDFVVDDKIVLELKINNHFSSQSIKQLDYYLKATNLKLGILIIFTKDGIKFKRILNIKIKK